MISNMEDSSDSKMNVMKPVILKAGIPLAIAVGGFIITRIVSRKPAVSTDSSFKKVQENQSGNNIVYGDDDEQCLQKLESLSCIKADDTSSIDAYYSTATEVSCLKERYQSKGETILRLRARIEDLQERELHLETRVLRYQEMKEQELIRMELHNKLMLEINKVDFLVREMSLLEAENGRFDDMVIEYLKVVRLLQCSRSEKELLRKRVRKLLRKTGEHSRILRKQSLRIQTKEAEILDQQKEIEVKADCIKKLEGEIMELKTVVKRLQWEKHEISNKLKVAEESALTSKIEGETVPIEEYNKVVHELEQLQMDMGAEVKELINLRWSNACLRHELVRMNQEHSEGYNFNLNESVGTARYGSDHEPSNPASGQSDSLGFATDDHHHVHSRSRGLKEKFKKWVEKGENNKKFDLKAKNGSKYKALALNSSPEGAQDLQLLSRKSWSSF